MPGLGKSTRQNRRGLPICGESARKRTFSLDLTHKRERLSLQCSGTPLSASAASTDVDLKARVRSDVRFCEMSGETLLNTSIPFYTTPRCVNSRLFSDLASTDFSPEGVEPAPLGRIHGQGLAHSHDNDQPIRVHSPLLTSCLLD